MIACSLACGGGAPSEPDGGPREDAGLEDDAYVEVSPLECGAEAVLPVGRETCDLRLVHDGAGYGMLWSEFVPRLAKHQWWLSLLDAALRPRGAPFDLELREPTEDVPALSWQGDAYVVTIGREAEGELLRFDREGALLERKELAGGGRAMDVVVDESRVAITQLDPEGVRVLRFDRASDRMWASRLDDARGLTSITTLGSDLLALAFSVREDSVTLDLWRVGTDGPVPTARMPTGLNPGEDSALVASSSGALAIYTDGGEVRTVAVDETGSIEEPRPLGFGRAPGAVRSGVGDIGVAWLGIDGLMFARVDERGSVLQDARPVGESSCVLGPRTLAATPEGFVVVSRMEAGYPRATLLCRE